MGAIPEKSNESEPRTILNEENTLMEPNDAPKPSILLQSNTLDADIQIDDVPLLSAPSKPADTSHLTVVSPPTSPTTSTSTQSRSQGKIPSGQLSTLYFLMLFLCLGVAKTLKELEYDHPGKAVLLGEELSGREKYKLAHLAKVLVVDDGVCPRSNRKILVLNLALHALHHIRKFLSHGRTFLLSWKSLQSHCRQDFSWLCVGRLNVHF